MASAADVAQTLAGSLSSPMGYSALCVAAVEPTGPDQLFKELCDP